MQRHWKIYRWLLVVFVLCGLCHTAGAAYAYDRSSAWGYAPVYSETQTRGAFTVFSSKATVASYGPGAGGVVSAATYSTGGSRSHSYAPAFNQNAVPAFRFQSTSLHTSSKANTSAGVTMQKAPSSWGDPEEDDNPIGVVPDPQPIGEPLILLAFALLYLGARRLKRQ